MTIRALFALTLLAASAAAGQAQYPPIYSPYRYQSPYLRSIAPVALPSPFSNPAFRANYSLRQSIRPTAGVYPYAFGSPYGNVYLQAAAARGEVNAQQLQFERALAAERAQALQAGAGLLGGMAVPGELNLAGQPSDTPGFLPDGKVLVPGDIHVLCPTEDTELSVNGMKLDGQGLNRHLNVPAIPIGRRHQFTLTAKYTVNGQERTSTRVVVLNGMNHGFANMK